MKKIRVDPTWKKVMASLSAKAEHDEGIADEVAKSMKADPEKSFLPQEGEEDYSTSDVAQKMVRETDPAVRSNRFQLIRNVINQYTVEHISGEDAAMVFQYAWDPSQENKEHIYKYIREIDQNRQDIANAAAEMLKATRDIKSEWESQGVDSSNEYLSDLNGIIKNIREVGSMADPKSMPFNPSLGGDEFAASMEAKIEILEKASPEGHLLDPKETLEKLLDKSITDEDINTDPWMVMRAADVLAEDQVAGPEYDYYKKQRTLAEDKLRDMQFSDAGSGSTGVYKERWKNMVGKFEDIVEVLKSNSLVLASRKSTDKDYDSAAENIESAISSVPELGPNKFPTLHELLADVRQSEDKFSKARELLDAVNIMIGEISKWGDEAGKSIVKDVARDIREEDRMLVDLEEGMKEEAEFIDIHRTVLKQAVDRSDADGVVDSLKDIHYGFQFWPELKKHPGLFDAIERAWAAYDDINEMLLKSGKPGVGGADPEKAGVEVSDAEKKLLENQEKLKKKLEYAKTETEKAAYEAAIKVIDDKLKGLDVEQSSIDAVNQMIEAEKSGDLDKDFISELLRRKKERETKRRQLDRRLEEGRDVTGLEERLTLSPEHEIKDKVLYEEATFKNFLRRKAADKKDDAPSGVSSKEAIQLKVQEILSAGSEAVVLLQQRADSITEETKKMDKEQESEEGFRGVRPLSKKQKEKEDKRPAVEQARDIVKPDEEVITPIEMTKMGPEELINHYFEKEKVGAVPDPGEEVTDDQVVKIRALIPVILNTLKDSELFRAKLGERTSPQPVDLQSSFLNSIAKLMDYIILNFQHRLPGSSKKEIDKTVNEIEEKKKQIMEMLPAGTDLKDVDLDPVGDRPEAPREGLGRKPDAPQKYRGGER